MKAGRGLLLVGAASLGLLPACSSGSSGTAPKPAASSTTTTPSGARLLQALAVAVSRTGVVYVADYGNESIDRVDVDPATKKPRLTVVTTLPALNNGAETGPDSLAVDAAGDVIFAENGVLDTIYKAKPRTN